MYRVFADMPLIMLWFNSNKYIVMPPTLKKLRGYIVCPHLREGGHIVLVRMPLALTSASHFRVCTISCELVIGFLPNFHGYIIGTL